MPLPQFDATPLLLFDLDGTLIDSGKDLATSLNHSLTALGLSALPEEDIAKMVGKGARHLVMRGLQAVGQDESNLEQALSIFLNYYQDHLTDNTACYPGILAGLSRLQKAGCVMHICTNKPTAPTIKISEQLLLTPFFSWISGGDCFGFRKPDPRHLLAHCEQAHIAPGNCIMIGDSDNDILAANKAGMPSIAVTYGGHPQSLNGVTPSAWADHFDEVVETILQACGKH